jgi:hypothetical protein
LRFVDVSFVRSCLLTCVRALRGGESILNQRTCTLSPHTNRRRCEAILRSKPDSRAAAELHLACIDGKEEREQQRAKKAAAGTVAVAALGAAVAIGGMLMSKR